MACRARYPNSQSPRVVLKTAMASVSHVLPSPSSRTSAPLPSLGVLRGWAGVRMMGRCQGSQSQVSLGAEGALGEMGFLRRLPGDLFSEPSLTCVPSLMLMIMLEWSELPHLLRLCGPRQLPVSPEPFYIYTSLCGAHLAVAFVYRWYHAVTLFCHAPRPEIFFFLPFSSTRFFISFLCLYMETLSVVL